MSPRRRSGRFRPQIRQILVEDQAGFSYPVSRLQAAELFRAGIVRPVPCRGGVKLQERGSIRAIYSTRYLHDRFSAGLRLYRDDLIKTVSKSRTGKPATAQRSNNAED